MTAAESVALGSNDAAAAASAYGRGKRPYPPGTRERFIAEGRALGAIPEGLLPRRAARGSANNASGLPPIGNQGSEGSCTAWAGAYAVKTYYMKKANPALNITQAAHQASPRFAYNLYNGGDDNGGYGHEPFEIFMRYGCASMTAMPYVANQYTTLPRYAQFVEGLHRRTTNYVWLWDWAPNASQIAQAKAWLDNGGVAVVGVYASSTFEDWNASKAPWVGPSCTIDDIDHMVCVCGYGPGWYLIANSWGTAYGSNGFIYVNASYFEQYISDFMFPLEGAHDPPAQHARLIIRHPYRSDIRTLAFSVNGQRTWNYPPIPKDMPLGTGGFMDDARDNIEVAVDLGVDMWVQPTVVTATCADQVSVDSGSITNFTVFCNGLPYVSPNTPVAIGDNNGTYAHAAVYVAIPEPGICLVLMALPLLRRINQRQAARKVCK